MKKINIILIAFMILLNIYLFKVIDDLESRIDTTDDLIINNSINSYTSEITEALKDVDKYIVAVKGFDKSGTGFIYQNKDDVTYIVTAAHVVKDQNLITVEFNNYRSLNAEILGIDEKKDIAVLKVLTNFNTVPCRFTKNSVVKDGDFVLAAAASNSSNYNSLKSLGIISSTLSFERVHNSLNAYVVSDTKTKPGYSGGPLFNISSEVIGMCTMESNDDGNTYVITADEIKLLADEIIETGTFTRYELGIKFKPVNKMQTYQKSVLGINADILDGIYVYDAGNATNGAILGIKNGDIIKEINDKQINNLEDYLKAIYSIDNSVVIEIIRDGNEFIINSSLGVLND